MVVVWPVRRCRLLHLHPLQPHGRRGGAPGGDGGDEGLRVQRAGVQPVEEAHHGSLFDLFKRYLRTWACFWFQTFTKNTYVQTVKLLLRMFSLVCTCTYLVLRLSCFELWKMAAWTVGSWSLLDGMVRFQWSTVVRQVRLLTYYYHYVYFYCLPPLAETVDKRALFSSS